MVKLFPLQSNALRSLDLFPFPPLLLTSTEWVCLHAQGMIYLLDANARSLNQVPVPIRPPAQPGGL
jgi:hypothetical protein